MSRPIPASASDMHCELELTIRRMKILTDLLTYEDGQKLTEQAVTDLHFWIDELADIASKQSDGLSAAINGAHKEAV